MRRYARSLAAIGKAQHATPRRSEIRKHGASGMIFIIPIVLGSCTSPDRLCKNKDPDWMTTDPHDVEPVLDVVKVNLDRTLNFNVAIVDQKTLTTWLRLRRNMSPSPDLLLRHEDGADCLQVYTIRRLIDQTLGCSSNNCAEGPDWNWVPDKGFNGFG